MPSPKKAYVDMGEFKGQKASEEGLETDQIGPCVGVVVTGEPYMSGKTRFLFHISLGKNWDDIRPRWFNFVEAIEESRMSDKKGWILTIDTTLSKDPDYRNNEYMRAEVDSLKPVYERIGHKLQHLICGNPIVRVTHGFGKVCHMEVDANNVVKVDGHQV